MARPKAAGCPHCTRKSPHAPGVRHLPSKKFQARFLAPDGRSHSKTFQTERDATAWLGGNFSAVSKGTWTPIETQTSITFHDFAATWLANRRLRKTGAPLADRTRACYQDLLDRFLLPEFGAMPVHTVTREDVERWYARTAVDIPTTQAKAYSLLRTLLNSAVDSGHHPGPNPARIHGAGRTERRHKVRPATLDELHVISEAMPPRYRLAVHLAAWCALRFGELTELRRVDVDTREGVLRIRRSVVWVKGRPVVKAPKSSAGVRDIAIPPALMPLVREHLLAHTAPTGDGLLFPAKNDASAHLRQSSLAKVYYPARKAAGREDLRWHDLRHTGATRAAQAGATLAELQARIGHSTVTAAMTYQHAAADRDRVIAQRLSAMIEGTG